MPIVLGSKENENKKRTMNIKKRNKMKRMAKALAKSLCALFAIVIFANVSAFVIKRYAIDPILALCVIFMVAFIAILTTLFYMDDR